MTEIEAIKEIEERVQITEHIGDSYVDCVDIEALRMAIFALKQMEKAKLSGEDATSDCISRQGLKESLLSEDYEAHCYCFPCKEIMKRIDEQPSECCNMRRGKMMTMSDSISREERKEESSQNVSNDELISKKAAIETVRDVCKRNPTMAIRVMDALQKLPVAQPEVLACGSGELSAQPEPEGNSIHDLEELAEKVGSATVYDAAKEERTEEHAEMHACDSIHDIEELAKKVGVAKIEEARNEAKKDDPYKHDTDLISRRAAIDIINRIENMDPKAKGGITVNLALLPDLNPEPDLRGEILEAVEMLKEKYEEAKKISYINKPFEYALYNTWKEFDGRNKVMR